MTITSEQPKITVVGSSSIDLILKTVHPPLPHETVMAYKSEIYFGGKGANQAVGTARLGANVYFVGCVGMDPQGQQIMRNLIGEGVNVGYVTETEDANTGTAYVRAADSSYSIVIVPSANHYLKPYHIDQSEKIIATSDLILIQLEIPMDVVEHTVEIAKRYHRKVGIYAAPASKLSQEIIDYATFIVVKRDEISTVFGDIPSDEILKKYPNKVFVRDATNATSYFNGSEMKYFRNDLDYIYRMGMGDAFTSGFSVAYCHGNTIDECVLFGNDISLKVAQKLGSQTGLPYLKDLL